MKYRSFTLLALGLLVATVYVLRAEPASGTKVTAAEKVESADPKNVATAVFAGGCFWCVETDFEHAPGVLNVVSGYSGGTTKNPNYNNYHDGHHIEVVQVTYDSSKVTFAGLVEWLLKHIDPTDAGGSFGDRGDGYKPAIFYADSAQQEAAKRVIASIDGMKIYKAPIQVELLPAATFWPAEDYHQDYHASNNWQYSRYRFGSGRDAFVRKIWGENLNVLQLDGAYPSGVVGKGGVQAK